MPQLGETIKEKELGFKGRGTKIWAACENCGMPRWVNLRHGKPSLSLCKKCGYHLRDVKGMEKHAQWKGGRLLLKTGYIGIKLAPDDFFMPTATCTRYIFEHRLVMAKHLRRNLHRWEIVHHKNGIKDDNRIDNLELTNNGSHAIAHSKGYREGYQKGLFDAHTRRITNLEARVTLLEAENELLRGLEVTQSELIEKRLDFCAKKF